MIYTDIEYAHNTICEIFIIIILYKNRSPKLFSIIIPIYIYYVMYIKMFCSKTDDVFINVYVSSQFYLQIFSILILRVDFYFIFASI